MKRYGMVILLLAAVVGMTIPVVFAQPSGRGGPQGGPQRSSRFSRFSRGGQGGVYLPDYTARIPDLTPEQRARIAEIRQATMQKIAALQREMNEQIKRVLNPDQARAMEDAQRRVTHRGPDGIIMTDEQKKVMDEARAEAAKVDDPEARSAIMQEAIEQVRKMYTDEQKKQAEEYRQRMERFRNMRMRGRGGRGGPGGQGGPPRGGRPGGNSPA